MPELRDIVEGEEYLTIEHMGFRLRPVASADVPPRSIFLNTDSPNIQLCFKDGDGDVFRFRMQSV